jgi:hypothetical protein
VSDRTAGESAQAEYDLRAARHAEDLRRRRPRILAFGLAVAVIGVTLMVVLSRLWGAVALLFDLVLVMSALFTTPNTITAWKTGAEGEVRTARLLAPLDLNVMKKGLRGGNVGLSSQPAPGGPCMLYAGLDLSRQRLDVHVLDEEGRTVEVTAATPEVFGLREFVARISRHGQDVSAVIESMNGARFVHDQLELAGWDVEIADAAKVKGLAPLAAKTDKIDA